jgi:hypothetical protein
MNGRGVDLVEHAKSGAEMSTGRAACGLFPPRGMLAPNRIEYNTADAVTVQRQNDGPIVLPDEPRLFAAA